jgi:DNA-binding NarL/FixJ family response regulator
MNFGIQETRTRLVLIDDPGLFRSSLGRLLAAEPDLEVAADCAGIAEALEFLKTSNVDIALLDFAVGTENGCDLIARAQRDGYMGKFLILAGSPDVRNSAMALKLGAAGIFLKSEGPDRLVQAIRLVRDGGMWVDPRIIRLLAEQSMKPQPAAGDLPANVSLEDRERNVLRGILEGLSNRKIGATLGLSESSVKNIVQHLFAKASVRTRSQLVRAVLEGSRREGQPVHQLEPTETLNRISPFV